MRKSSLHERCKFVCFIYVQDIFERYDFCGVGSIGGGGDKRVGLVVSDSVNVDSLKFFELVRVLLQDALPRK